MSARPSTKREGERDRNWLAQNNLIIATKRLNPRYHPAAHHWIIAEALQAVERGDEKRVLITVPPRHGKQIADSTPVPTPTGWTRHGDLRAGDVVFGVDGSPTRVVAVSEPSLSTLDVTFSDGSVIKTHPFHEWTVFDRSGCRGWRTIETRQLAARKLVSGEHKPRCTLQLPARPSLDLPRIALPLDPYVLGAWLGDGTRGRTVITHHRDDHAVISGIVEAGFPREHAWVINSGTTLQSNFPSLRLALSATGVIDEKRIPPRYLRSSEKQRLQLLAGIIDTDGSVAPDGRVRIVTVSDDLASDIVELIRTLGWRAGIYTQEPSLSTSGIQGRQPVHYIGFTPDRPIPTRMPNKVVLGREDCQRRVGIVSVSKTAEPEYGRCIQVDRIDGLYLVGREFIPTHNSELGSVNFPPWYLGRNPDKRIIGASYAALLAYQFSRRARNIVAHPMYPFAIDTAGDLSNVQRWDIAGHRGGYLAAGVGGSIAGHGADILLIDDPVGSAEQADSLTYRDRAWEWYTQDAYTRLEPGGAVIVIGCLTGDTRVLMASGHERLLCDIRPGDAVATYENGALSTSTVLNWINHGPDRCFAIRMKSGIVVRANARHPFLVEEGGKRTWQRTDTLKPGSVILRVIGESGEALRVPSRGVTSPLDVRACACLTTGRLDGQAECDHLLLMRALGARHICDTDTALVTTSTSESLPSKAAYARSANSRQLMRTLDHIGAGTLPLTIATIASESEGCSATHAISRSVTEEPRLSCSLPPNMCELTTDTVLDATLDGYEDVFDIEVARTENFIANGLVGHNTRWHEDDLIGRMLNGADRWHHIDMPAINAEGEALWPDRFPVERLDEIAATIGSRAFTALYQQRPSPQEGSILKREQWMHWRAPLPMFDWIVQAWDTAFKTGESNDYSVGITMGLARGGFYLLNLWRGRVTFPELKRVVRDQYDLWQPHEIAIEDAASGQSLIQEFSDARIMPGARSLGESFNDHRALPVVPFKPDKDKLARVNAVSPYVEGGHVFIPADAAWVDDFVEEAAQFPNGAHDDQVDALTIGMIRLIERANSLRPVDPGIRNAWSDLPR